MRVLKRILRIIIFLLCVLILINIIPASDAISVNPFSKSKSPIVATQSGGGIQYPDNVMASFNAASYYGVMYFSIGAVMTSDEVLIVADIDDLETYTNGSGKISQHTFDEISALNFAYNFTSDNVNYPYRAQTLTCLKLEDLFDAFPYSNFIIDIKQTGEEGKRAAVLLCEIIRQKQLSRRVVIKGDNDVINFAREDKNSTILTEPFEKELSKFEILCKLLLGNLYNKLDFQFMEIPLNEIDGYSKFMLSTLQKRNVSVFISDVNSEEDYKKALTVNPDGIITRNPKLILQFVQTD